MRPLGDVEVERRPAVEEGQRQRGAQADVLQREHADRDRRQREREAGPDAGGRQVEARALAEQVGRDDLAQFLDELQVAGEGQRILRIELDRDVGLPAALRVEAELRDLDLDRLQDGHAEVGQLAAEVRRRRGGRLVERLFDEAVDVELGCPALLEGGNAEIDVLDLGRPVERCHQLVGDRVEPRLQLGRALSQGGIDQQLEQVERAEQRGGARRKERLGIELVDQRVGDGAGQRPDVRATASRRRGWAWRSRPPGRSRR